MLPGFRQRQVHFRAEVVHPSPGYSNSGGRRRRGRKRNVARQHRGAEVASLHRERPDTSGGAGLA